MPTSYKARWPQVDFKENYEETITNIQLQEQLKVTKNYALDVTRVLKEVDILQSQTEAEVALIAASAKVRGQRAWV